MCAAAGDVKLSMGHYISHAQLDNIDYYDNTNCFTSYRNFSVAMVDVKINNTCAREISLLFL